MLRQSLKNKQKSAPQFKMRGLDNTRIEALSDGVFALAIALLLISSEVPSTFDELSVFLKNFFPFAATISILTLVWYQHYIFFARYGLKDARVVALNTLLLFLVLFFVYPLKFLFQVLFELFPALFSGDQMALEKLFSEVIRPEQGPSLMVLYGGGLTLVFVTMAALYFLALRNKTSLKLNRLEIFDTKSNIYTNLMMASVPFVSFLISFFHLGGSSASTFSISGMLYMSYCIVMPVFGRLRGNSRIKFLNQMTK